MANAAGIERDGRGKDRIMKTSLSIKLPLQFFAEDGAGAAGNAANADGMAGTEGTAAAGEASTPPSFDDLLKNKDYQSEFDKRVNKALETARTKWDEQKKAELTEQEKLAKMKADEKAQYEREKREKELQGALRKIIKSSPALNTDEVFKTMRSEIRCILTDSEYTPLAYSEDRMDGKMANIFLADEAGAMDDYPVEAMRSSQITLRDKLGIIISTQYPNDNNVFITEIDYAKKVLDGFLDDPRYFSLLYEPDSELTTGDQWQTNDLIIYQSNPVANDYDYIFEDLVKKRKSAILYESKRENYLCKHNNILYKSLGTEGFVEITKVRECRIAENLGFWRGKRVWIGLDLSLSEDNTAVAMLTEYEGEIYAKVWGFLPANRVDLKSEKENVDYRRLIREGACFECGDEIVDYSFIERFILGLPEKYGVEIVQVGYDRWNAISTAQKLESEAITCVEIRQHSSVLHRPTKMLKEAILSGHFHYDENQLLEINFTNARCTEDTNLNKYVNKKKSAGKVDLVVAVINALCLLQLDMEAGSWGAQIIE